MAGVEKIIKKMHTQPSGIRFDEAAKVLEHYGYILERKKAHTGISEIKPGM